MKRAEIERDPFEKINLCCHQGH